MIVILLIIFLGIILFPDISFSGATTGLILWSMKVLPALFPAMLITSCVIQLIPSKSNIVYPYIIASGIFCGYPAGAYSCSEYHKLHPDEKVCENIMACCNISSPAFVINYIYPNGVSHLIPLYKLLIIVYLPIIIILLINLFKCRNALKAPISAEYNDITQKPANNISDIFNTAVISTVNNSLKIGGYIVFFSCISSYMLYIFKNFEFLAISSCGIIEITNGIGVITQSNLLDMWKIILIVSFNAFGGLSTLMQTTGVIKDSGISIKKYIYQKLLTMALTAITAIILIYV